MREWYLSSELAGLEGMANSTIGVSQKAKRNNWLRRKSAKSNNAFEYHISNFHPDVKKQLIDKYVTDPTEARALLQLHTPFPLSGFDVPPHLAKSLLKALETGEGELVLIEDHDSFFHPELAKMVLENKDLVKIWLRKVVENSETKTAKEPVLSNVTELSNIKEAKPVSQMGDMCAVPVYNVYASCGFGAQNDAEYQLRTEFLPCMWLKRFGLTEETARIIICHGDSMEDTLSDGDEVLVDIRELDHPVKHGVYVVRIGKHVYIKRLKYDIMAEGYEVISDNKEEYDSFIVNEEKLDEFAVIGKVVTTVMKAVV